MRKEQKLLPKHIKIFEILQFSDNMCKITMVQSFFLFRKVFPINLNGIDSIVKFQGFQIFGCEFGK